jgi:hypothetical protein
MALLPRWLDGGLTKRWNQVLENQISSVAEDSAVSSYLGVGTAG